LEDSRRPVLEFTEECSDLATKLSWVLVKEFESLGLLGLAACMSSESIVVRKGATVRGIR
jgi:hypothetical protein